MKAISKFLFALLAVSSPVFAEDLKVPGDLRIFVLAGQSNMAGRGQLDDDALKPHPRAFSLNKEGKWQPAVDPLHWDKKEAGTGIGKPFAEIVAEANPAISIGLVPTACGGSSITSWVPGGYHGQTKSHPYDDCLARTREAVKNGKVQAILWHQGESDSNPKQSGDYEKNLEAVIGKLRAEFGAPDLPVIIGQLGRFPARPWTEDREKVDAAHQALARKLKNVRYVSAEGLTSKDNLHFDTPSLRILARRYADAYFDIVGKPAK